MELLRLPPFPLILEYDELGAADSYVATFANSYNQFIADVEEVPYVGTGVDSVSFALPERFSRYDGEYSVIVYEGDADNKGDVVLMDTLRVVRPYINPAAIAPTGKLDEYIKWERTARIMIDNFVGGFYYKDMRVQTQGTGADKLPIGRRANKLLSVIENNTTMYELDGTDNLVTYELGPDRSLIVVSDTEINYLESPPVQVIGGYSDSYNDPLARSVAFPWGYDYTVWIEAGWPMVPQDIKEATSYLIEDMACGVPNYWSKYVREYETKDFRADFQRSMFDGTGNLLVDQILLRYFGDTLYDNIRVL